MRRTGDAVGDMRRCVRAFLATLAVLWAIKWACRSDSREGLKGERGSDMAWSGAWQAGCLRGKRHPRPQTRRP